MNDKDHTGSKNQAPDDPAELADRFATLWRENLSAMAQDPTVAKRLAESLAVWSQMTGMAPSSGSSQSSVGELVKDWMTQAQSWTSFAQRASEGQPDGNAATKDSSKDQPRGSEPAFGTSSDAKADHGTHSGSERLLYELLERISALEQRIADLESSSSGSGRRAAQKDDGDTSSKPKRGKSKARKTAPKRPPKSS